MSVVFSHLFDKYILSSYYMLNTIVFSHAKHSLLLSDSKTKPCPHGILLLIMMILLKVSIFYG